MDLFHRSNSSHNPKHTKTNRQPSHSASQQAPRKEILEIADKMMKKHRADLEYLKDR